MVQATDAAARSARNLGCAPATTSYVRWGGQTTAKTKIFETSNQQLNRRGLDRLQVHSSLIRRVATAVNTEVENLEGQAVEPAKTSRSLSVVNPYRTAPGLVSGLDRKNTGPTAARGEFCRRATRPTMVPNRTEKETRAVATTSRDLGRRVTRGTVGWDTTVAITTIIVIVPKSNEHRAG